MGSTKKQKQKKTGLPKALEQERGDSNTDDDQTPEEFAREFFGDASQPQEGLPSREWLKENFQTKSAAIRFLGHQGHTAKVIAKHLDIRYQHARNVLTTELKRGPNEPWIPKQHLPQLSPPKKEEE